MAVSQKWLSMQRKDLPTTHECETHNMDVQVFLFLRFFFLPPKINSVIDWCSWIVTWIINSLQWFDASLHPCNEWILSSHQFCSENHSFEKHLVFCGGCVSLVVILCMFFRGAGSLTISPSLTSHYPGPEIGDCTVPPTVDPTELPPDCLHVEIEMSPGSQMTFYGPLLRTFYSIKVCCHTAINKVSISPLAFLSRWH